MQRLNHHAPSRKFYVLISTIFFLFLAAPVVSQEQVGRPLITNYRYLDYDAAPTNWWAVEDDNGIMYFANNAGVMQYDGVTWTTVDDSSSRCLAFDDNGVLYSGGFGDFGYLEANDKGVLEYKSLLDKVPEEHKEFREVWEVDNYKGRIIFRTNNKLFVWDGESIKVIPSEDAFHVGNIVHGKYYVRIWNKGLCILTDDDTFEVVTGGERFADERIYVMLPFDENRVLLGTRTQGFFIFDGETYTPFKTEADEFIKEAIYLPGLVLDNGNFVINTFADGTYLINKQGKLIQKYTTDNGLQDGSTSFVFLDSRGVLWMPLFNGISQVNLNSSVTSIDSNMGLPTNVVFTTYKFNDLVYLSTNNGIFYLEPGAKEVKLIEGTSGQGTNFIEHDGRLFAGTGFLGLIEIKGRDFEFVRKSVNYDLRANELAKSKLDENRLYVSTQEGIVSFYFDEAKKQYVTESETKEYRTNDIRERKDGALWLPSPEDGEWKLMIPSVVDSKLDFQKSEVFVYNKEKGIPESGMGLFWFDEEFVGISGDTEKTYRYDYENDRFEEHKFPFNDLITWQGRGIPFYEDYKGRHWFGFGDGIIVAEKDESGNYVYNTETFKELKNRQIYNVFVEETGDSENTIAWISGPDGVVRYEGNLNRPTGTNFNVKIRNVTVGQDSLIYAGNIDFPEDVKINNELNTVNLGYAAPFYIGERDMQYKTYLEGLDADWSDWIKQTNREYINLPPGRYTFKVKAKNLYGDETEEASVDFSILPPWYKTWWAYALYVLGFLLLVYAIVRSRTRILVNQRKALEDKVEERTREVSQRLTELATVNQVSQALTQKLELNELIQMVGNEMKKVFKSDITYLALLDAENGVINFPFQDGDNMAPMKFGEGLTSKIIQTGEALLINHDTDIEAEYQKSGLEQTGKKAISYLGVPIPVEDKIIGVLSVQSTKQASRFNEEDKRLLNTIAINVGVALHNAELYEEAKEAKAKAEDANEAKSAFLSTVSHELRTPLTSVLGFAKIIRKRLEDKVFPAVTVEDQKIKRTMKQVSENLNVVVSEGERLTNLINDVLDLAKIESGRMEWHMKPVFLQDVINRAIASTSSLFDQKGLTLQKNISSDLPLVSADEDKLIQVVINLLSNAVKFTDKGKVSIDAYQDEGQIIVEVQDTGIGIADDDKHKVFERFRQAGDTLTDKPQGTGLGLPICREIIEHHGGIIWMKSDLGVGSTFFFSIPTMGDTGSEQPIQLDRILNSLKKQIKHSSLSDVKKEPTILVVDDDTPIRSLLRQELGDAGYQVQEAANGKAALDMVRMSKPDLIILDVMMPEINGFDVAAVLKNDPATMDIPIIILSIVQDKERGLKIGVDRYLTKPINTEQLFHEVDELLEQGVSKKKVLVVDEDASAVKTLSEVLNARGYKVLESEPKDLIKNATEAKPDIIMLNSVYNGDQKLIKDLKVQKGMENTMFFIYE